MSNKRFAVAIVSIVMAASVIIGALLAFSSGCGPAGRDGSTAGDEQLDGVSATPSAITADQQVPSGPINPLTGLALDNSRKLKVPVAVMIDNHRGARPQSGFNKADVVYEILAEGGISRYMMVFYSDFPARIGPIRSAREYFIDRSQEYSAVYVHAGGSSYAIDDLKRYGIPSVNGLATNSTYRATGIGKYAPHNLYSTRDRLLSDIKSRGFFAKDVTPLAGVFTFGEMDKSASSYSKYNSKTKSFKLAYRYASSGDQGHAISYRYDSDSGKYKRYVNGVLHKDELDGKPVMPANVIVQVQPIIGHKGKELLVIRDTGMGSGYLFSGGKSIEIVWKKPSRFAKTEYYDKGGEKLVLRPGQTFIQVIPAEERITW